MLRRVAGHKQQDPSLRILPAEPVHTFFQIGVGHLHNGFALVSERVLEDADHLGFICRGFLQLPGFDPRRRRRTYEFGAARICLLEFGLQQVPQPENQRRPVPGLCRG